MMDTRYLQLKLKELDFLGFPNYKNLDFLTTKTLINLWLLQ